jgi:tRNA dimethylallyltransferase
MTDILDPKINFSVGDFVELCSEKIEEILSRNKVPILVGGTGLYFDWIINGRWAAPKVSEIFMEQATDFVNDQNGWVNAYSFLHSVDPEYAQSLKKNDFFRLTKAIGFFMEYKKKLSSFNRKLSIIADVRWKCIYMTCDRELLYRNIDRRCIEMIDRGLLEEVYGLIETGKIVVDSTVGRSIGYKEALEFFQALRDSSKDPDTLFHKFINDFMTSTRQYARKQETWFANQLGNKFVWFDRGSPQSSFSEAFIHEIEDFVSSENEEVWFERGNNVLRHFRGEEAMEARRKLMYRYRSNLGPFSEYSVRYRFWNERIKKFIHPM